MCIKCSPMAKHELLFCMNMFDFIMQKQMTQ